MDHTEAGKYWNENAEAWTVLARAGVDIYRDHLNTPAFFKMLPDIKGLQGIDIGCGEGYNTRLLAERGAIVSAIDISDVFITKAKEMEIQFPLQIQYLTASSVDLPFAGATFDFATGFMSFMDVPETGKVLSESFRVLKAGGFLQFSISHPCFNTPHRKNVKTFLGKTYAVEVGGYFKNREGDIDEWIFSAAPHHLKKNFQKFKTPIFTRTLSQWINALTETGFVIEKMGEPTAGNETAKQFH